MIYCMHNIFFVGGTADNEITIENNRIETTALKTTARDKRRSSFSPFQNDSANNNSIRETQHID